MIPSGVSRKQRNNKLTWFWSDAIHTVRMAIH